MDESVGTFSFLFTDVVGSTDLLRRLGTDAYSQALGEHRDILRAAFARHAGEEVGTEGDSFFVVFRAPSDAIAAALEAQLGLGEMVKAGRINVRMGIHTGEASRSSLGWVGLPIHVAARISGIAAGGQILVSETSGALLGGVLPPDAALGDLGLFRLKDVPESLRLFDVRHPKLAEQPAPVAWAADRHNLPSPTSSLIGRDGLVADMAGALTGCRLLTLTGPGGVGKTRVGIEVARQLAPDFKDGAWFVGLASVGAGDVWSEVAGALGLAGAAVPPREAVVGWVATRDALIVIDNAEHVVDEVATVVSTMMRSGAGVRGLVTSREPLGLDGETVRRVPPLGLDPDGDAVALFVARAESLLPAGDDLGPRMQQIAEICSRLDGLPLAIELVAARAAAMSFDELAAALDRRLDLRSARRDVEERHRSLRATLEWTHDLLSDDERSVLRRLSVFAGSFPLSAAEEVAGAEAVDVVETVVTLVSRSLVERRGSSYALLETIREFAAEQLEVSGEGDEIRGRHARWYAASALTIGEQMKTDPPSAIAIFERDALQIDAAIDWFVEHGDGEDAAQVAAALYDTWWLRRPSTEFGEVLGRILAATERVTPARALCRARLACWKIRWELPEAEVRLALGEARESGDALAFAIAVNAAVDTLPESEVTPLIEEASERAAASGDLSLQALVRLVEAEARAMFALHVGALPLARDALRLARASGDAVRIHRCVMRFAMAASAVSESMEEVTEEFNEARASCRVFDDRRGLAVLAAMSAGAYEMDGQHASEAVARREAAAIYESYGDTNAVEREHFGAQLAELRAAGDFDGVVSVARQRIEEYRTGERRADTARYDPLMLRHQLGSFLDDAGRLDEAERAWAEATQLYAEHRNWAPALITTANRVNLAVERGDMDAARALVAEGHRYATELGQADFVAHDLESRLAYGERRTADMARHRLAAIEPTERIPVGFIVEHAGDALLLDRVDIAELLMLRAPHAAAAGRGIAGRRHARVAEQLMVRSTPESMARAAHWDAELAPSNSPRSCETCTSPPSTKPRRRHGPSGSPPPGARTDRRSAHPRPPVRRACRTRARVRRR